MSFFGGLFRAAGHAAAGAAEHRAVDATYAVGLVARSPIMDSGLTVAHVGDLVLWTAVFVAGTVILFRRDTKRV